jgi:hypothetical protein
MPSAHSCATLSPLRHWFAPLSGSIPKTESYIHFRDLNRKVYMFSYIDPNSTLCRSYQAFYFQQQTIFYFHAAGLATDVQIKPEQVVQPASLLVTVHLYS